MSAPWNGKYPSRNPSTATCFSATFSRKAAALFRASVAREPTPLKTIHRTMRSRTSVARRIIVPPQPISMSSAWAPRQSSFNGRCRSGGRTTRSMPAARLNNRYFRNRHDELGVPVADVGELSHNLVLQIPRQEQHVVGPGLGNLFRREDRNVRAGQIFPLLIGVTINRIVQEIGSDTTIVEQRVAFAGRAVPG